ncbi:MAG: DUF1902 domain-containing protein [Gammaproteobacteria bacterium]
MGEAESRSIVVRIAHDEAAGVWFIESSDLAGLSGETKTVEALRIGCVLCGSSARKLAMPTTLPG